MATVSFAGPASGSVISPAYQKMALNTNYLDIQNDGWAKQYLPELYEQEVDRYGNRTISGFLSMLSAEMPLQSDQVIWSEQGRLHLAYEGEINPATGLVDEIKNIDTGLTEAHAIRKGATVVCTVAGVVFKAYVNQGIESSTTAYANGEQLDIFPYAAKNVENVSATIGSSDNQVIKFFVYGSEFGKGTDTMQKSLEPKFLTFTNRPMIIKDHFEINGSDTAQIGWIEVAGESGQGGYLWYLKSSGDTRVRFNDYMEMTMVEAEKVATSETDTADSQLHDTYGDIEGSEGLFSAVENRGIVATNLVDNATDALADFDLLLAELDKQGAIEENMLYLNRASNLMLTMMVVHLSVYLKTHLIWR